MGFFYFFRFFCVFVSNYRRRNNRIIVRRLFPLHASFAVRITIHIFDYPRWCKSQTPENAGSNHDPIGLYTNREIDVEVYCTNTCIILPFRFNEPSDNIIITVVVITTPTYCDSTPSLIIRTLRPRAEQKSN